MCHESAENRESIYEETPTLSQKYNLNFDPFALFLSVQRIVGRNSQEIVTTLFEDIFPLLLACGGLER